jgi:uncharacterized integral membrane protein
MPVSLALLLLGGLALFLTALANSQEIQILLIFFPVEMSLGGVVLLSAAVGAVLAVVFYTHMRSYLKFLNSHKTLRRSDRDQKKLQKSRSASRK